MSVRLALAAAALGTALHVGAPTLLAQPRRLTRADAVNAAISSGARLAIAAGDTAVARALALAARAYPSPSLAASYTESTPRYHLALDLPLEYPARRSIRIESARYAMLASQYRFQFERASAAFDADTLYIIAQGSVAKAELSKLNAVVADSLRRIAQVRRDAGDASDLDVELATLYAGEQRSVAATDTLELYSVVLSLQSAIGLSADSVNIEIADSLAPPAAAGTYDTTGVPVMILAAQSSLAAANLNAQLERRSRWSAPGLSLGFETYEPGGTGNRLLPTIGVSLPLPFLNWNRASIAMADAERDRAMASLASTRIEVSARIARTRRERDIALARVTRDQGLMQSARRVADMSLTAFREGAAPITTVLDAQRTARDLLRSYIEDVTRASIAVEALRWLTLSVPPGQHQ